jgi:hypothetical protein
VACGDPEDRVVVVVTTLAYMRGEEGVSWGFDVDGTEDDVCDHDDYTSPDGVSGIDNGMAILIPLLEASEAKVIEGLLNSTIVEGRLLLAVEITRVDDLQNDSCVDVEFFQATGDPLLGTDGGILPGQTLIRDTSKPTSSITGMSIVDGVLDAFPMNLDLPLSILDAEFEFNLTDGGLQIQFGEDGLHTGFFAGVAEADEIYEIAYSSDGIDDTIQGLIEQIVPLAQDVKNDQGECANLSAGLEFEAGEIFLYE